MNERPCIPVTAVILVVAAVAAAQAPAPQLTLRDAAEMALAHAPEVAAARAAADESAASARLAGDASHPQVWLTSALGWARGLPMAVGGSVPAALAVSCRTTLYDRSSRIESLQREAASSDAAGRGERARLDVLREVLVAYARCWADDALVAAGRERQRARTAMLERAQERQAAGRSTEFDVEQARLTLARARLHALDLDTDREFDRLDLSRLTGVPPDRLSFPARDPLAALPELPDGDTVEAAQAADPELRASARSIKLLDEAAGMATGGAAPVIQAEAQYARLSRMNEFDSYYSRFQINDWSVGVVVALPLWGGGRGPDLAARTAAGLARRQNERRTRADALAIKVQRAAWNAERARAATQLGREAVAAAEEGVRLARARAAEGRGDEDAVDTRAIALAEAREEMARTLLARFVARVERLALCGDLENEVLGPARSTPGGEGLAARAPSDTRLMR